MFGPSTEYKMVKMVYEYDFLCTYVGNVGTYHKQFIIINDSKTN